MKPTWLHTNNNTQCILFFNGWGMDEHAVSHINAEGFDVCMLNDYRDLHGLPDVQKYSSVYIIAWSMGVWAAHQVCAELPVKPLYALAINGTELPIHNSMGIPEAVFTGTAQSWDDSNKTKFNMRMCGGGKEYRSMKHYMSKRNTIEQQEELLAIEAHIKNTHTHTSCVWDKAIIGEYDMIFTAENQKNYWLDKVNSITLPIPHFPFHTIRNWRELLDV